MPTWGPQEPVCSGGRAWVQLGAKAFARGERHPFPVPDVVNGGLLH